MSRVDNIYRPVGWHSRGYLPHFDGGEIPQFITFRLGDSMPQGLLERWREELAREAPDNWEVALRRRVELYLDQGYGKCYLRDERVAAMAQNALLYFDGERYRLAAWVVMPNHTHFLLTPLPKYPLGGIMHSLKSYTAHRANKILRRAGQFWQEDYYDRYLRDYEHYVKTVAYIENNPVKARLCERPEDWPYSSARVRLKAGSADISPADKLPGE
jgi:putative DNA methylase